MLDFEGEWGWGKIQDFSTLKDIHEKLKNFEQMKWGEIEKTANGRKNNHCMDVCNLSTKAQQRLEELQLDDCEELFSFRLSGKKRVWGIRDQEKLNILWWDPEHTVYPVQKGYT